MTFGQWDWKTKPLNMLVSFAYVDTWHDENKNWNTKATMLDSGAYSAWKMGKVIDMDKLCQEAAKPCWDEVVALDVIGDGPGSLINSLEMKNRGLTVMPVFHYADPWEVLEEYKKEFGRIGLASGHGAPKDQRMRWTAQCFARAYPAQFHSFGWTARDVLLAFPFVTADSSSWAAGRMYGRLQSMPSVRVPTKKQDASNGDLRVEILHYLELQDECTERWKNELAWTSGSFLAKDWSPA